MNNKHFSLLKKCSDKKDLTEWNLHRLHNPKEVINLKFYSLDNFYLLGANLSNINFKYTSLNNTKMNGANVEKSTIISRINLLFIVLTIFITIVAFLYFFNIQLAKINIQSQLPIISQYTNIINYLISSIIIMPLVMLLGYALITKVQLSFTEAVGVILVIAIFEFITYWILYWILSSTFAWGILATFSALVILIAFSEFYSAQQKSIANAINPLEVINFNTKYLHEEKESERLKDELSQLEHKTLEQEKIKKELDENKNLPIEYKEKFQTRLELLELESKKRIEEAALLKDKLEILERQEEEEELIEKSMNEIKASFMHINKTEKSLNRLNFIYGILLTIGILMLSYFSYISLSHREIYFEKLQEISFTASLGIVIFYATPIIFSFSIIIFALMNIKENIKSKEVLLEKKYFIDLIESSFPEFKSKVQFLNF